MIKRVHHINFLVNDLEQAISRYQDLLGVAITRRDDLPDRGVKTGRFRLGEQNRSAALAERRQLAA